jgi:hypothetical protein
MRNPTLVISNFSEFPPRICQHLNDWDSSDFVVGDVETKLLR